MKIRVVKTASKANVVQVVRYQNSKRVVLPHIGSAHSAEELEELILLNEESMRDYSSQLSIFSDENPGDLFHLNRINNKIICAKWNKAKFGIFFQRPRSFSQ